jgi:hypothetical protein
MKKYLLENNFHNTEVVIRIDPNGTTRSKAWMRRIRSKLCPSWKEGCLCGDCLGARRNPPQMGDIGAGYHEIADGVYLWDEDLYGKEKNN